MLINSAACTTTILKLTKLGEVKSECISSFTLLIGGVYGSEISVKSENPV